MGAALWAVGMMLTALEAVLFVSHPAQPWEALLFSAAAVTFLSAGVVAWMRRPSNRMGPLLYLSGIIVVTAGLQNTTFPALVAAGLILGVVPIATVLHGLLAFSVRAARARLGAGAHDVGLISSPWVAEAPRPTSSHDPHRSTPSRSPTILIWPALCATVARWSQLGVLLCSAAVLIVRLRAATPHQRQLLGPLYAYGVPHPADTRAGGRRAARTFRCRTAHRFSAFRSSRSPACR